MGKEIELSSGNSQINFPLSMPHFYEHHEPLMVPYNFDMTGYGGGSGFGNDFHASLPIGHEHTAALHSNGALGAETNNVVTNITGAPAAASPGLSAYATVGKLRIKLF
jgi:hypothetical protein